ncbi:hypothetical protein [Citromicrobium bathyomarinum]|uniref:hypothetical protein n=1 Tax=Citromicrobium bathyomarinum TaxID=72174 RepID=UPI00315B087F
MAVVRFVRAGLIAASASALAACATVPSAEERLPVAPVTAELAVPDGGEVELRYRLAEPTVALHFAQRTGDYRETAWHPLDPAFRWVAEGDGERLERADGRVFDNVALSVTPRYRSLVKAYGPFSPFSDGSLLVYSGQFHACASLPCDGDGPLPLTIDAPGRAVATPGTRSQSHARFVSEGSGSNVFVGNLAPVAADGFNAIVDPGLPEAMRARLATGLPDAMRRLADAYGPLSTAPDLYVSIDRRAQPDGNVSIQGGTLPNQIFMHFDGEGIDRKLAGPTDWIDWFFAHEAGHLYQQELAGSLLGDDRIAWIHEGGADALAALVFTAEGRDAYVQQRTTEARDACRQGLEQRPLTEAAASAAFDMHYACGMILMLALNRELRGAGSDLHAFDRSFFGSVRSGAPWTAEHWFATAGKLGASDAFIAQARALVGADNTAALAALAQLAPQGATPEGSD